MGTTFWVPFWPPFLCKRHFSTSLLVSGCSCDGGGGDEVKLGVCVRVVELESLIVASHLSKVS